VKRRRKRRRVRRAKVCGGWCLGAVMMIADSVQE